MPGRAVAVAGPGSSLAITGLGRIVIGRWQLTAGGLLREPAQFGDARRDKYVPRERSHGVPVRHFWRWSGHSARLSHGRLGANCNAYECAAVGFHSRLGPLWVISRRDWLGATIGPHPPRPESGSEIRYWHPASMRPSGPNALGSRGGRPLPSSSAPPLDCPVTLPPGLRRAFDEAGSDRIARTCHHDSPLGAEDDREWEFC